MKPTIKQIRETIHYENNTPLGSVYFIGPDDKKARMKRTLASIMFFDECKKQNAFGHYSICRLLLGRKLPEDLIKFYVETGNGGNLELQIIANKYDIKVNTDVMPIQYLYEFELRSNPNSLKKHIEDCFKGYVVESF